MGETLKKRLKQKRFDSQSEETILNLFVASNHVYQQYNSACGKFGLTMGQYNVLRILRGIYPDGHPRGEISDRLIWPAPDVTRLLDRLNRSGLIARSKTSDDLRQSIATITPKGLRLLETMDPLIRKLGEESCKYLSSKQLEQFSNLCELFYSHSLQPPP